MATVSFKKGVLDALPAVRSEGTFYVTTDERGLYLDIDNSTRVRFGDFQEFANLAALQANTNPSTTALYYITDLNVLAKWTGEAYVQINLDTGATSVEVVGEGNAVTAASYDPATRKLTFTRSATYTTASDVSGMIASVVGDLGTDDEDAPYTTVKAYVDDKVADVVAGSIGGLGDLASKDEVSEAELEATLAAKINGKADQTTVDTLVGADTGKSVRNIAAEELAAQLIPDSAKESLDTLAEIAAWIQGHPDDASAMNAAIEALQAKVDTGSQKVSEYVAAAIAALSIGDYAKAADLTTLAGRVDALEDDTHTHANKEVLDGITSEKVSAWDAAEQNAKTYADGLASNYDAAGSANTALNDAKAYTDTALTWGSF